MGFETCLTNEITALTFDEMKTIITEARYGYILAQGAAHSIGDSKLNEKLDEYGKLHVALRKVHRDGDNLKCKTLVGDLGEILDEVLQSVHY